VGFAHLRLRSALLGGLLASAIAVSVNACSDEYVSAPSSETDSGTPNDSATASSQDTSIVNADASALDASQEGDAETDAPSVLQLGAPCTSAADCASGICSSTGTLGAYETTIGGSVCIQPCCTTEQCGAGFVCAGTSVGGNYCLQASKLGLTLGASKGGAQCAHASECASGRCVSNVCADTCCSDTDCGASHCRVVTIAPTGNVYACSLGGTVVAGGSCAAPSDCESGNCFAAGAGPSECRPPCCGQANAVAEGYDVCSYTAGANSGILAVPLTLADGNVLVGGTCSQSADCKSGYCDSTLGVCTDVCCVDSDCASYGTYSKCRPLAVALPGGTVNPLFCTNEK
jgi:hypothetical protein